MFCQQARSNPFNLISSDVVLGVAAASCRKSGECARTHTTSRYLSQTHTHARTTHARRSFTTASSKGHLIMSRLGARRAARFKFPIESLSLFLFYSSRFGGAGSVPQRAA